MKNQANSSNKLSSTQAVNRDQLQRQSAPTNNISPSNATTAASEYVKDDL